MEFLVVFDFDATLIKTTLPDVGKGMWSSHHGIEYPHVGWWGRKESLDSDVFDNDMNDWVHDQYKTCVDRGYSKILLTGRMKKLRNEVNSVLDKHNIDMDGVYLSSGNTLSYKLYKMNQIIEQNKETLEKVVLYDDRLEHNSEFVEWSNSIKELYGIEVIVDLIIDGVGEYVL